MLNPNILRAFFILLRLRSRKMVTFCSFNGLYNDNPLYISEMLHRIDPNLKIVWIISKKSKDIKLIPEYIKIAKYGTVSAVYYAAVSAVIVDNYIGFCNGFCKKNDKWKYVFLKNIKQFNISTWHGTPLKKIGADVNPPNSKLAFFSTSDLLVIGSLYSSRILRMAFDPNLPVALWGSPRNHLLLSPDCERKKKEIQNLLSIDGNKKVVLYAPTFRDNFFQEKTRNNYDFLMDLNVNMLLQTLSQKFGGEWLFVFRGHQLIDQYIPTYNNTVKIIDGNLHDDMAKYLLVSDVLITDYSGSLFDFALTTRPCFLYTPDLDDYLSEIRGIYGTMDDLPYDVCKNNEQLNSSICHFNSLNYTERVNDFMKRYGYYEHEDCCINVARMIIDIVYKRKDFQQIKSMFSNAADK